MVVQHNMQAANANRMLNITTSAQSKSTEKLSSGYKINRAADDAAGLSISEKMRKQIRGLDQASTNAEDGVSAVQTAEGALNEVQSMLQRMNELATQAANGTNSESDRDAIQNEISQLTTEIDRVAETTKFNETYLLKGSSSTKSVYLTGHDAGIVGTDSKNVTFTDGAQSATLTVRLQLGSSVTIGGKAYTIVKEASDKVSLVQSAINTFASNSDNQDSDSSITIGSTKYTWDDDSEKWTDGTNQFTGAQLGEKVSDGVKVVADDGTNKTTYYAFDTSDTSNISRAEAVSLIHTALVQANSIGVDDATEVDVTDPTGVSEGDDSDADYAFTISKSTVSVSNDLSFNLHVGADTDMSNKITVDISAMSAAGLGVKGLNVKDDSGVAATYAIDAISDAISRVSAQRSALGAIQNRLEHTIDNVDNVVENTTSAESRIRDTDMAEEMVNYSKNNILSQAGQSMLAQANSSNQGVLSLLG